MCEHKNTTFTEGEKCCTDCGLLLGEQVYVRSYNRICSYRRQPMYSRQKRFYQFVTSLGMPVIFQNLEAILLLFSRLEFFWCVHPKQRKYFFNRFVTLVFILNHLDIPTKNMRTLKDKDRVMLQLRQMQNVLNKSF